MFVTETQIRIHYALTDQMGGGILWPLCTVL
jgi:hypothetical protein